MRGMVGDVVGKPNPSCATGLRLFWTFLFSSRCRLIRRANKAGAVCVSLRGGVWRTQVKEGDAEGPGKLGRHTAVRVP